ncbi:piezo-type mechanosensitive ion channel component-like [Bacillus rossius redtenbacheri]|uniref:piezo-type mechanosensitive ion channel component-like n=1 Tax=Bacillus rossius redtenbacheri TaxID=93214 RepID=UPI002FDE3810
MELGTYLRRNFVSMVYLLLLAVSPLVKLPSGARRGATEAYVLVVVACSALMLVGHAAFHAALFVVQPDSSLLVDCGGLETLLRHAGFMRLDRLARADAARAVLPDAAVLGVAVATYLALRRAAPRERRARPSPVLLFAGKYLSLAVLACAAAIQPSLPGAVYLLVLVVAMNWWACGRELRQPFARALRLAQWTMLLQLCGIVAVQWQYAQDAAGDIDNLYFRLFGLTVLATTSCDNPQADRLMYADWDYYATPAVLLLGFNVLAATSRLLLRASSWDSGSEQPQSAGSDSVAIDVEGGDAGGGAARDAAPSRAEDVMDSLKNILLRDSYLIASVAMMVWSITHHSLVALVLLVWACLAWIVPPSPRTNMLRTSPLLVAYAHLLLAMQYLFSLDLEDHELPPRIGHFNINQLGFERYPPLPHRPHPAQVTVHVHVLVGAAPVRAAAQRQRRVDRPAEQPDRVRQLADAGAHVQVLDRGGGRRVVRHEPGRLPGQPAARRLHGALPRLRAALPDLLPAVAAAAVRHVAGGSALLPCGAAAHLLVPVRPRGGLLPARPGHPAPRPAGLGPGGVQHVVLAVHPPDWSGDVHRCVRHLPARVPPPLPGRHGPLPRLGARGRHGSGRGSRRRWQEDSGRSEEERSPGRWAAWRRHDAAVTELVWRFLMLYLVKVCLVLVAYVCVYDVCPLKLVLLMVVVVALLLGRESHLPALRLVALGVSALVLVRTVYQSHLFRHEHFDVICLDDNGTDIFEDYNLNDAEWFGMYKIGADFSYGYIIRGYTVLIPAFTLLACAVYRVDYIRARRSAATGLYDPPVTVVFPGVNRANADQGLGNFLKFVVNYGFYKFGVELCFVMVAVLMAVRLDVYACMYGAWLCVMVYLPRRTLARVWVGFVLFTAVVIPAQYLIAIGMPDSLCTVYPWYGSDLLLNIQAWFYLPGTTVKPPSYRFMCDFLVLVLACHQHHVFRAEALLCCERHEHLNGGSNEDITDRLDDPGFRNPIPDFFPMSQSWLDATKRVGCKVLLWLTLALVILAGVNRVNVFSFGYLGLAFWYLWRGERLYLRPARAVVRRWGLLLLGYNLAVMMLKMALQIVGCVLARPIMDSACWVVQLLGISCRVKASAAGHGVSECPVPDAFAGLWWDALCFAALIFTRRFFGSRYFLHLVNDTKVMIALSDKGAKLFTEYHQRKANEKWEWQQENFNRILRNNRRIVERQRRIEGPRFARKRTHIEVIQSGDYYMFETIDDIEFEEEAPRDKKILSKPMTGEALREALQTGQDDAADDAADDAPLFAEVATFDESGRPARKETRSRPVTLWWLMKLSWAMAGGLMNQLTVVLYRTSSDHLYVFERLQWNKNILKAGLLSLPLTTTLSPPASTHPPSTIDSFSLQGKRLNYSNSEFLAGRRDGDGVWRPARPVDEYLRGANGPPERQDDDPRFWLDERQPPPVLLLSSLYYVVTCHSQYACFFSIWLIQVLSASLLSLPLPLAVFLWALFIAPHPNKPFWVAVIFYTEVIIVIKCVLQFEFIIPLEEPTMDDPPLTATRLIGVDRSSDYVAYELVLLMMLYCHRFMLRSMGLWGRDEELELIMYPKVNPATNPGTNPGSNPGTNPGSNPGTNPDSNPGTNPDSNPGTNPGSNPGTNPGSNPGTNPDSNPGTNPDSNPGTNPDSNPGTNPDSNPGTNPGSNPGTNPGSNPGTNPGSNPGTNPGSNPGTNPGSNPGTNPGFNPGMNPAMNSPANPAGNYRRRRVGFFQRLLIPTLRVPKDVYTFMFACSLVNFLILLFGFLSFGVDDPESNLLTLMGRNRIPMELLLILLVQFLVIIADRIIYLCRAVRSRVALHFVSVVVVHWWLFFILPVTTKRPFNSSLYPPMFYMVQAAYFVFSAYQIRCGFPLIVLGNVICSSYGAVNYYLFKVYLLVPFLMEMRGIMDWMFTTTSMSLMTFLATESIHGHMFRMKCKQDGEALAPRAAAVQVSPPKKHLVGGVALLLIFAIIWCPLYVFTIGMAAGTANPPHHFAVTIEVMGHAPLYRGVVQGAQINTLTQEQWDAMKALYVGNRQATAFLQNYDSDDVAVLNVPANSTAVWEASPVDQEQFRLTATNTNEELRFLVSWLVSRDSKEQSHTGKSKGMRFWTLRSDDSASRRALVRLLSYDVSTPLLLTSMLPKFLEVTNQDTAYPVQYLMPGAESEEDTYRDLELRLYLDAATQQDWWEIREPNCSDPRPTLLQQLPDFRSDCWFLPVYTFNEKMMPLSLSKLISDKGVITLYVTFVYVVAMVVRTKFISTVDAVMFEELPYVDRIMQLCVSMYLAREFENLALEEYLYAQLVFLLRSPETLIRYTRPPEPVA